MSAKKGNASSAPGRLALLVPGLIMAVVSIYNILSAPVSGSPRLASISINGVEYNVYLAVTPEQQEKGLMNVTSIGDCYGYGNCIGMLFVGPKPACFWMKDTRIPLMQYWIGGNEIRYVWAGVPYSTNVVCSQGNFVLETNASSNFRVGDSFVMNREFG